MHKIPKFNSEVLNYKCAGTNEFQYVFVKRFVL